MQPRIESGLDAEENTAAEENYPWNIDGDLVEASEVHVR